MKICLKALSEKPLNNAYMYKTTIPETQGELAVPLIGHWLMNEIENPISQSDNLIFDVFPQFYTKWNYNILV